MKTIISLLLVTFALPVMAFDQKVYDTVKMQVEQMDKECNKKVSSDNMSTNGMAIELANQIECLENILKKEIEKAFTEKATQEEVLKGYTTAVDGAKLFYNNYHTTNKYCTPFCGTTSSIAYINDWHDMTKKFLTEMLYLNTTQDSM